MPRTVATTTPAFSDVACTQPVLRIYPDPTGDLAMRVVESSTNAQFPAGCVTGGFERGAQVTLTQIFTRDDGTCRPSAIGPGDGFELFEPGPSFTSAVFAPVSERLD